MAGRSPAQVPMNLNFTSCGHGPDLLLLHGWGMHSGVWGDWIERLAERWRIICIDLPGHGYSDPVTPLPSPLPAAARNLTNLDAWVHALLAVAPPQAVWLGWSLGGLLALRAARLQPERIRRLVLLNSNPCFVARADWPSAMPTEVFEAFAARVNSMGAAALPRFLSLQTQGLPQSRSVLKTLQARLATRPVPSEAALQTGLALLGDSDARADWAACSVPRLALFGAHDALVPVAAADALQALAPSAQVVVLDDAAHTPFISHPDATLNAVVDFLHAV